MHFEKNHLYHIYNRGNISQKIFYQRDNYLFFLKKIKQYVTPYGDILAWCLMPNHFHLMVYVNHVELPAFIERLTRSEILNKSSAKNRTFNESIGIMLRTYTRAIQKQEKTNGSLFQEHTKAICLTRHDGIDKAWFDMEYGTIISQSSSEKEYPAVCFKYIHQNPVAANLCDESTSWEFCSVPDYCDGRNGKLVNRQRAEEFGLI